MTARRNISTCLCFDDNAEEAIDFWSPRFGVLTDRFGVAWAINVFVAPTPR